MWRRCLPNSARLAPAYRPGVLRWSLPGLLGLLRLLLRLLLLRCRMLVAGVFVAAAISTPPLVVLLRALLAMLRSTTTLRLWFTRLLVQRIAGLEARDHALLHLARHEPFDRDHQRPVVETDQ